MSGQDYQAYTIVAGADLSARQHRLVNISGVLAGSETNYFGVLQNKPNSGEHASVVTQGRTNIWAAASIGKGALIGQGGTTSGGAVIVTSGHHAIGYAITDINSGYTGQAILFGGLSYLGL